MKLTRYESLVILGPMFLVLGLVHTGATVQRYRSWQGDLSAETTSIGDTPGPFMGASYTIAVDGSRHECPGGEKYGEGVGVAVVYDPSDPARCREKAYATSLGPYERFGAGGSIIWLFGGLIGSIIGWRMRAKKQAELLALSEP